MKGVWGNSSGSFELLNSGLAFWWPAADAGNGAVDLRLARGTGSLTFTRATSATTILSNGLITTVAPGVARSCYSPSGQYLGYLAEETRTNLCLQSEDLATTWAVTSSTVSTNTTASPSGTVTADTITATAASGNVNQSFAKAASALAYTLSVYVKPGTVNIVRLQIGDTNAFANAVAAEFNVATGVISTAAATIGAGWTAPSAAVTAAANGFFRVILTGTSTAVATLAVSVGHNAAAVNTNTVISWGAQLEQATFVTSYIPTTTVAVARNADVMTIPSSGNVV